MEKPRFRRWLGYNYLPLNLSAWLTIVALLLVEMPIIDGWLRVDAETPVWWALAFLGFAGFVTFWAVAHWNSE